MNALDQIRTLNRQREIPYKGALADLMWSDPEDSLETWAVSQRGAGWLFGSLVTNQFNQINGLDLICRAHQLVMEGYKYHFEKQNLVTVWSAPNYVYRSGNDASILSFDDKLNRKFKIFKDVHQQYDYDFVTPVYFL